MVAWLQQLSQVIFNQYIELAFQVLPYQAALTDEKNAVSIEVNPSELSCGGTFMPHSQYSWKRFPEQ